MLSLLPMQALPIKPPGDYLSSSKLSSSKLTQRIG